MLRQEGKGHKLPVNSQSGLQIRNEGDLRARLQDTDVVEQDSHRSS